MNWPIDNWQGCYPSNWRRVIVPEAMAHPAKYSSKLIRRIYEHLIEVDWLKPGDRVVDPFGGVALGALDAMRLGLDWTGIELEEKFHALGNQNIDLWNTRYGWLRDWGSARLLHGDSRGLLEIVATGQQVAVSSPPYADEMSHHRAGNADRTVPSIGTGGAIPPRVFGSTPGQLGEMRADAFDAAIGSPPYDETDQNYKAGWERFHNGHAPLHAKNIQREAEYGTTEGQLSVANDFWVAARVIVEQVYQALVPGGHAVFVVKDYVKNRQRVPFCDQWRQLCESVGFATLHEHRAMLVHRKGAQYTLDGGMVENTTESKSFFRRLAEKKGSPRIDWETVYCMEKG